MNEESPSQQARINSAHSILWYIEKATSKKYPKWRNTMITFLYKLFDLANKNYGLDVEIKQIDGIDIYYDDKFICFIQIRQRFLRLFINEESLILDHPLTKKFPEHYSTERHNRIYRISSEENLTQILDYLKTLPIIRPKDYYKSRTIPARVQAMVWDRDKGHCVRCGSTENLCFDHIIPFSKGGTSKDPKNIQILCAKCNLEKGNRKFL